ncbi:tRNA lysidine(34) synthetase TilS [Nakamurella multipartita]|uniref:tRNA(Ile)-lysidine synthase n=1 Tax=Nakamurella multipartita (strain ATCC 700099 / DSM 44233 / CIP 104796 / JCM 9543 / NBRC 105858 / Y-104) TaxID=479431 RepID=C8XA92_NAKMY|nr:tRNA lysidine(34) synthetase TilS [Nakamurella multipartita]ACV77257.1 tRNA(Ile)-lysidine synthetase [Nakamurella multipartita DSM 44233]
MPVTVHGSRVATACSAWLSAHAPGGPVVVACSGGADSLALTLGVLAAAGRRPVIGATVDHGLQPGSADRAAGCAELMRRLGCVQTHVLTVTVTGDGGLEAAARRARYGALAALAQVAAAAGGAAGPAASAVRVPVLLGHTADDQAETVLLGLARGSGPRSIAGMRPWRAPWGRPLLALTRAQTEAAVHEAGLIPWSDPHNADPAFTRVRLRREALPLLEDVLGGGVRDALVRTADLMADDLAALDDLAADALAGARSGDALLIEPLVPLPAALRRRVLRAWLAGAGAGPLTYDHLSRLDRQLTARTGSAQVRVPGGLDVSRRDGALTVARVGSR